MNRVSSTHWIKHVPVLALLLFALFAASPAHAQTAAQTSLQQCAVPPSISAFQPFIYEDGDLHSFEYIVNAPREVVGSAVVIQGTPLDHRYTTHWAHSAGTRVHVDVPDWDHGSASSVTVRIKTGPDASCENEATFFVPTSGSGNISGTQGTHTGNTPAQPVNNNNAAMPQHTESAGSAAQEGESTPPTGDHSDGSSEGSGGEQTTGGITDKMVTDIFQGESDSGTTSSATSTSGKALPFSVWVLLAFVHLAIAVLTLWLLRDLISRSDIWLGVVLLVPFIFFLALWFMFDTARAFQWFPIVIALVSLGTVLSTPVSSKSE